MKKLDLSEAFMEVKNNRLIATDERVASMAKMVNDSIDELEKFLDISKFIFPKVVLQPIDKENIPDYKKELNEVILNEEPMVTSRVQIPFMEVETAIVNGLSEDELHTYNKAALKADELLARIDRNLEIFGYKVTLRS